MSNLPDWLRIFELRPKYIFGLWLLGCLVLFLPKNMTDAMGITPTIDPYRGWIGIATLGAFVLWLIQLQPWEPVANWYRGYELHKHFQLTLDNLSEEERILLAYCIARKQKTIHLSATNPIATSLRDKGFFEIVPGFMKYRAVPYAIPLPAWEELLAQKHLLLPKEDWNSPVVQQAFEQIEGQIADSFSRYSRF